MNALIEKSIQIEILGRSVNIKPLTLKQTICLGTLLGGFYEGFIKGEEKEENFLSSFIKSAKSEETDEIINILTNFSFAQYKNISSEISLNALSLLIKTVSEVNDFEAVAANFKYAFGRMKI